MIPIRIQKTFISHSIAARVIHVRIHGCEYFNLLSLNSIISKLIGKIELVDCLFILKGHSKSFLSIRSPKLQSVCAFLFQIKY